MFDRTAFIAAKKHLQAIGYDLIGSVMSDSKDGGTFFSRYNDADRTVERFTLNVDTIGQVAAMK